MLFKLRFLFLLPFDPRLLQPQELTFHLVDYACQFRPQLVIGCLDHLRFPRHRYFLDYVTDDYLKSWYRLLLQASIGAQFIHPWPDRTELSLPVVSSGIGKTKQFPALVDRGGVLAQSQRQNARSTFGIIPCNQGCLNLHWRARVDGLRLAPLQLNLILLISLEHADIYETAVSIFVARIF